MSKPLQVLRSQCRALQLLRRTPPAAWDNASVGVQPLPGQAHGMCTEFPAAPSTATPSALRTKAKLRLLVPVLRRALSAAAQQSQRRRAQLQREHELQAPARSLQQSRLLAEWLCVCLSPTHAPELRICWILV